MCVVSVVENVFGINFYVFVVCVMFVIVFMYLKFVKSVSDCLDS